MNKKFARSFFSLFLALIMTLSFAVIPSSAAKVKLNKSSVTVVKDHSVTLSVSGTNKKITWTSADSSIATVSKKGKVTGKKLGTTTVSASFGKSVLKCKVTVKAGSISTNKNKLSVDVGGTAVLSVKAVGLHELAVSSSDSSVAKAALSGSFDGDVTSVNISGISDGTAKIKIYAKGYEKSIYKYAEVKVGRGKPTETVVSSGVTVSADSVEVNENLSAEIVVTAPSSTLGKLKAVSSATYKFGVTANYDIGKDAVIITVNGLVEGSGDLRIYDPNDKKIDIHIPVTVTNNAYDVVVWNREPKKRTGTDIVYTESNNGTLYYVLEPKTADPAHAASLLAQASDKYEYMTIYEDKPEKQLDSDVILSKSEKYNGKKVTRYLLAEVGYDEAYTNSAFGMYFGVYDYYKVYANMPTAAKYGDRTCIYEYTLGNGKKDKRFILTEGSGYSGFADDAWEEYKEKYGIETTETKT